LQQSYSSLWGFESEHAGKMAPFSHCWLWISIGWHALDTNVRLQNTGTAIRHITQSHVDNA
jgi:hypothetical protein